MKRVVFTSYLLQMPTQHQSRLHTPHLVITEEIYRTLFMRLQQAELVQSYAEQCYLLIGVMVAIAKFIWAPECVGRVHLGFKLEALFY